MKTRILFLTHEPLGSRMAGPAIRAYELAKQLCSIGEVTLASSQAVDLENPALKIVSFGDETAQLKALVAQQDILVVQGLMLDRFPFLAKQGKYLVVDLYDPYLFESYPTYLEQSDQALFLRHWEAQNQQMLAADYSICASERQQDLWLGRYCALGRLVPELYRITPSFKSLIGMVPFGLPELPPTDPSPRIKGVIPGIERDDLVLLWGGGIWNWFDPLTIMRALATLERDDIKLFFMGTGHPNPEQSSMRMLNETLALAEGLGLRDRRVFFNPDWVPYQERHHYLLEADAGVSAHFDSIETRFSFRTRILDYLWSGLPILATEGDSMADLIERHGLGLTMPTGDVKAWQSAILKIAQSPETRAQMRSQVQRIAPQYTWSEAAKPLLEYCAAPYHTPKEKLHSSTVKTALRVLKEQGLTGFTQKAIAKIARAR